MQYRQLSDTNIKLSRIALGTWVFGGNMWSGSDMDACVKTLHKAIELGVNIIDTAPIYGYGISEQIIGKSLKGKRKDIVLATKCGLIKKGKKIEHCLRPSSIKKEVDLSLKRLKTDYIDIYQLHWPDEKTPLEETLHTMETLKKAGKVRHIGVCNFNLELLKKACSIIKIVSVQNEYSFLKRDMGESVFDFCKKNSVSFFSYGPLAGGILSGKYKSEPSFSKKDARSFFYKFYKGEGFGKAKKAVNAIEIIAKKYKAKTSQTAINWNLSQTAVTTVLSGARTPKQIEENIKSLDYKLNKKDISYLNSIDV